jgi:hypothetical protein
MGEASGGSASRDSLRRISAGSCVDDQSDDREDRLSLLLVSVSD